MTKDQYLQLNSRIVRIKSELRSIHRESEDNRLKHIIYGLIDVQLIIDRIADIKTEESND